MGPNSSAHFGKLSQAIIIHFQGSLWTGIDLRDWQFILGSVSLHQHSWQSLKQAGNGSGPSILVPRETLREGKETGQGAFSVPVPVNTSVRFPGTCQVKWGLGHLNKGYRGWPEIPNIMILFKAHIKLMIWVYRFVTPSDDKTEALERRRVIHTS